MRVELWLYVTGRNAESTRALHNLRAICDAEFDGEYDLDVIDVLEEPARAEHDKILATPTLVKRSPEPVRKIIGDLSDREKVRLGLDVNRVGRGGRT